MGLLEQLLSGMQPGQPSPLEPDAAPNPTMANPQSGPNPMPQPAQQAAPHRGMLKQALTRFVYGGSQAMVKMAGLPTDEELATAQVQRDHLAAQTQMLKEQTAQMGQTVMVPTPNGYMAVPASAAKTVFNAAVTGQYGQQKAETQGQTAKTVAGINAEAGLEKAKANKRFMTVAGVGLVDLADPDNPVLVPGSSPTGVTITPEIAGEEPALKQLIGKTIPITQYAGLTRSNAMQNQVVQGAGGPVAVNKVTGTAQPVKVDGKRVGNPGVETVVAGQEARARLTPFQTSDGRTISNKEALQTGAQGAANPLVRKGMEAFIPAYDADMRLKQMTQQSEDKTGASDMALLFNHIAMTGGNVKGMRLGEHITTAHAQARGIPEELAVLYNKVVSGQQLSQNQRDNFLRLGIEVRNSTWQRSAAEARAFGVQGAPEGDPDLPPPIMGGIAQPIETYRGKGAQKNPSRATPFGTRGKSGGTPIVQHSPSTGQYRHSLDGGKTWLPGRP